MGRDHSEDLVVDGEDNIGMGLGKIRWEEVD
jgi:hypothetical protein